MPEKSFDVARNIRMTQELQCQMLSQVADLFTAMHNNASKAEQTELLAKLEISLRLLAGRLGISQEKNAPFTGQRPRREPGGWLWFDLSPQWW